jgi:hypothetical protein
MRLIRFQLEMNTKRCRSSREASQRVGKIKISAFQKIWLEVNDVCCSAVTWWKLSNKCIEISGPFQKWARKPRNRTEDEEKWWLFGSIEAKPDTAVTSLTCQNSILKRRGAIENICEEEVAVIWKCRKGTSAVQSNKCVDNSIAKTCFILSKFNLKKKCSVGRGEVNESLHRSRLNGAPPNEKR